MISIWVRMEGYCLFLSGYGGVKSEILKQHLAAYTIEMHIIHSSNPQYLHR